MPLWGNQDNAANSDIAAVIQYNRATTSANQSALYDNVTANDFIENQIVGQFGVDTTEIHADQAGHGYHAGWVLRKEGTGLRAGRVTYETLVAMGSMGDDGSDDTQFPDYEYRIVITTEPKSNTSNVAKDLTFKVVAKSDPSGDTLSYRWQVYNGGWANVANTAGKYSNNTSPTFTANNKLANGNVFRVMITGTDSATVYSSNATITYTV